MKLLLDENLSRRMVPFLQNDFPGSTQVAHVGMEHADDCAIWEFARTNNFVIVTRDADFEELSAMRGFPPQVVWIRSANPSKSATLNLLLKNREVLVDACTSGQIGCIELGRDDESPSAVPPAPTFGERGFTLTEMAVVLVIVALLIGGMILPLSAQQDIRARQETERTLADIREALLGFAAANGRLPRPATSATDGAENPAACADDAACFGFIPWATLGVQRADAWGKLIRYSVTPAFANGTISLATVATRTVQDRDAAGNAVYLGGQASCNTTSQCLPAVVFSHGKRRWGTDTSGNGLPDGSATNADEDANNTGPANFFSRIATESTTVAGGEFDDLVTWLSTSILTSRLISAGRLP